MPTAAAAAGVRLGNPRGSSARHVWQASPVAHMPLIAMVGGEPSNFPAQLLCE
jgi:hypothetical protein